MSAFVYRNQFVSAQACFCCHLCPCSKPVARHPCSAECSCSNYRQLQFRCIAPKRGSAVLSGTHEQLVTLSRMALGLSQRAGRPQMHMASMRPRLSLRVTPCAPVCVGIKPLPIRRRVEVREVGGSRGCGRISAANCPSACYCCMKTSNHIHNAHSRYAHWLPETQCMKKAGAALVCAATGCCNRDCRGN